MVAQRQDAWTEEDDLILAEVTLRHIREGSTQLAAFEEVGQRLGRTAAACGFRWNSLVRKKYESAIQIAKAQRNQLKAQSRKRHARVQPIETNRVLHMEEQSNNEANLEASWPLQKKESSISYEDVIQFLYQQQQAHQRMQQADHLLSQKEEELRSLREEYDKLKRELDEVQREHASMNEDYQVLMRIMDRARKLAFLGEDEEEHIRFKMDRNGNLERVEKSQ